MAMNSRSNLVLVYVLLGVALGATYAVGGILFDNYTMRPEPLPLGELLRASPLHYLIFLSPVVLGVLFFFLGQGHAKTITLSEGKHATERNFKLLVDSVTDYAMYMLEALVGTGLSPQRLEIEVTESAIIKDKHRALKTLRELRSKGVSIAVDDFGTGYSSLDKLRSFPFDRLKIDQSFVAGLEKDAPLRAILGAILELGKSLHMETIVEGVETREQAKILVEAGCDALQGYLYAEPAPFASLRSATVASPSWRPPEKKSRTNRRWQGAP